MVSRVRQLLGRSGTQQTVGAAAAVISSAYLLSRLLGLLRDRLLVSNFGYSTTTDAYYAAFRLPELIFTLLVSGAFAVAFIPVFTEHLEKDQRRQAWEVASSLLTILVVATIIGVGVAALLAGPITTLLTPGFDQPTHDLAVNLTRIMLVTPIFFAVSSVLGSIQQSFNRFAVYAFSGVLYNLGIIAGLVLLGHRFGVYGVAYGVVGGVVAQAVLQWIGLYGLGFKFRPQLGLKLAGTRRTLKLMVPRSAAAGIEQINYLAENVIGSTLQQGAITAFTLANNLKNVPVVLISSSITTAVFPRLARRAAKGARAELVDGYVRTARLILFLAIPSAVFAVVMRGYIVRLLYGFGNPDAAATLGWFAGSIIFVGMFQLVARIFFALQDSKTPLRVSLISVPVNILLAYGLSRKFGVEGLAMAASLVALLETLSLIVLLRRREGPFGERQILAGFAPMAACGLIMTAAVYLTLLYVAPLYAADRGFATLAPKFCLLFGVGAFTYLLPAYLMRIREAHDFIGRIRTAIIRSPQDLN